MCGNRRLSYGNLDARCRAVPARYRLMFDMFGICSGFLFGMSSGSVRDGSGWSSDRPVTSPCYDYGFACRVPIVQRPRTRPFQGQNTGSNPVGDATSFCGLSAAVKCLNARAVMAARTNCFPSNATPSGKNSCCSLLLIQRRLYPQIRRPRQNALCERQDALYVEFFDFDSVSVDLCERELLTQLGALPLVGVQNFRSPQQ